MKTTTQYRYHGPLSSASIQVDGQTIDVLLNPKRLVSLPADHAFTQTLVAQKRLVAMPVGVAAIASTPAHTAPVEPEEPAASSAKPKKGE